VGSADGLSTKGVLSCVITSSFVDAEARSDREGWNAPPDPAVVALVVAATAVVATGAVPAIAAAVGALPAVVTAVVALAVEALAAVVTAVGALAVDVVSALVLVVPAGAGVASETARTTIFARSGVSCTAPRSSVAIAGRMNPPDTTPLLGSAADEESGSFGLGGGLLSQFNSIAQSISSVGGGLLVGTT